MLKKSSLISLRNYILVRFRGIFCYVLYIWRFYPGLYRAKRTNPKQIVDIAIEDVKYKMLVDLADEGIAIDLFIGRLREYPNVLYFKKFLTEYRDRIDTIVEIGANIGYYVAFEHAIFKRLKKKVKIYADEPVGRNMALLKQNISLNKIPNVTRIHAAVGEKDKEINVIVPPQGNYTQVEGVSGSDRYAGRAVREAVRMYTVKTLMSRYKIPRENVLFRWDIEGYEYNLVKGNYEAFRKLKNAHIIMEFHAFFLGKKKTIEFLGLLKKLGFRLKYVVSCYPPYFIRMPKIVRWFLVKTWLMEHNGTNLGILPEFLSLDDLMAGFSDTRNALYKYTNLHFYLVKDA